MAVLAASICARNGNVLVSRQFAPISRARVEALLSCFSKLVPVSSAAQSQHTTIATDDVRFVYQPLENLYLVLTTSLMSNILQDINLLQLFSRAVTDVCGNRQLSEPEVASHAFDLLYVFDELVSAHGLPEALGLTQLRTIIAMESNEERIQEMITRNKEIEAREQMRVNAKRLELERRAANLAAAASMPGHASGGQSLGGGSNAYSIMAALLSPSTRLSPSSHGAEYGGSTGSPLLRGNSSSTADSPPQSNYVAATINYGMRLGSERGPVFPGNTNDMQMHMNQQQQQQQQLQLQQMQQQQYHQQMQMQALPVPVAAPVEFAEPVHLVIDEVIAATVTRDGGVQSFEVRGEMMVHVRPGSEHVQIKLHKPATQHNQVQFKVHPSFDRAKWASESVLQLRDAQAGFTPGKPSPGLKWRMAAAPGANSASNLPLSFSCWTTSVPGSHAFDVTIEYELTKTDQKFKNLVVKMPCRMPPAPVSLSNSGQQSHSYDIASRMFSWQVSNIDSDTQTGSVELRADGEDANAFFPMHVYFECTRPCVDVAAESVTSTKDPQAQVTFGLTCNSRADDFQIL